MKILIVCSALVIAALAEPPIDTSYLPPDQGSGGFGPPSSSYGTPQRQTDAVFGNRPSSTYGAPTGASRRPSSQYGAPQRSQAQPGSNDLSKQYLPSSGPSQYNTPSFEGDSYSSQPSNSYNAPSFNSASRPTSTYGAPNSAASRPSTQYGAPNAGSNRPSSRYGAPNGARRSSSSYDAPMGSNIPSSQYVTPNYRSSRPSSQYSAPSGASRPSSQYGSPNAGVNRLSSQYGAPNAPSTEYSAPAFGYENQKTPSSQYGAPGFGGQNGRSATPSQEYGAPGARGNGYESAQTREYLPPGTGGRNGNAEFSGYGGENDGSNGEPANYSFEYMVKDEPSGNDFGHRESRMGDRAEGLYYVLLPDGRKQTVEYEADQDGYKPRISYEDTGLARGADGYDDNAQPQDYTGNNGYQNGNNRYQNENNGY